MNTQKRVKAFLKRLNTKKRVRKDLDIFRNNMLTIIREPQLILYNSTTNLLLSLQQDKLFEQPSVIVEVGTKLRLTLKMLPPPVNQIIHAKVLIDGDIFVNHWTWRNANNMNPIFEHDFGHFTSSKRLFKQNDLEQDITKPPNPTLGVIECWFEICECKNQTAMDDAIDEYHKTLAIPVIQPNCTEETKEEEEVAKFWQEPEINFKLTKKVGTANMPRLPKGCTWHKIDSPVVIRYETLERLQLRNDIFDCKIKPPPTVIRFSKMTQKEFFDHWMKIEHLSMEETFWRWEEEETRRQQRIQVQPKKRVHPAFVPFCDLTTDDDSREMDSSPSKCFKFEEIPNPNPLSTSEMVELPDDENEGKSSIKTEKNEKEEEEEEKYHVPTVPSDHTRPLTPCMSRTMQLALL